MFKCEECNKEFPEVRLLARHKSRMHGVSSEDTYVELSLGGMKPTCKCGCGEIPKFISPDKGYNEYLRGHASRVSNNWGHNPEAKRKSHETQKKMYSTGELSIWNKGLSIDDPRVRDNIDKVMANPERGNNISKSLSGKEKSDEHKQKLRESQIISWSNPDKREKQSHNRMQYIIKNGFQIKSKLEKLFKDILINDFNMIEEKDFYSQFYVRKIKALFDFKISGKPIFIEVDGDYWHCNPNGKFPIPIYEAQKGNLIQDKIKEKWCVDNNFKLIRFWEKDINERIEWVKEELKRELDL